MSFCTLIAGLHFKAVLSCNSMADFSCNLKLQLVHMALRPIYTKHRKCRHRSFIEFFVPMHEFFVEIYLSQCFFFQKLKLFKIEVFEAFSTFHRNFRA